MMITSRTAGNFKELQDQIKGALLLEASTKPVKQFFQFDAFSGDAGDMFAGRRDELRNGTPVRIQIEAGVSRDEAITSLKALIAWIESDTELFDSLRDDQRSMF